MPVTQMPMVAIVCQWSRSVIRQMVYYRLLLNLKGETLAQFLHTNSQACDHAFVSSRPGPIAERFFVAGSGAKENGLERKLGVDESYRQRAPANSFFSRHQTARK